MRVKLNTIICNILRGGLESSTPPKEPIDTLFHVFTYRGQFLVFFFFTLVPPLQHPTYLTTYRTLRPHPKCIGCCLFLPRNEKLLTVQVGNHPIFCAATKYCRYAAFSPPTRPTCFLYGYPNCIPTKGLALPTSSNRHAMLSLRTLDGVLFNSVTGIT